MRNNRKGFTLIELLVVIAIIGLLSTLAVVSLNNARKKSRDAKRVADMKQMQSVLELYYNDMNAYPYAADRTAVLGVVATEGATLSNSANGFEAVATGATVYMSKVPQNPAPGGVAYTYTAGPGTCTNATAALACTYYTISFTLEEANTNLGTSLSCHASSTGLGCP